MSFSLFSFLLFPGDQLYLALVVGHNDVGESGPTLLAVVEFIVPGVRVVERVASNALVALPVAVEDLWLERELLSAAELAGVRLRPLLLLFFR